MNTTKQKIWEKELKILNKRINDLPIWNDYAEYLQREYDILLSEDPRLKDNDSR